MPGNKTSSKNHLSNQHVPHMHLWPYLGGVRIQIGSPPKRPSWTTWSKEHVLRNISWIQNIEIKYNHFYIYICVWLCVCVSACMYACRQAWMYLCISVLLISKQWSQQRPNFSQFHPLKTSSIQLPETKEYIYLVRGTTLFKKQRLGQSALFSMQSVWGHHPHHTSIFIFSGRDVAPIEPPETPKKRSPFMERSTIPSNLPNNSSRAFTSAAWLKARLGETKDIGEDFCRTKWRCNKGKTHRKV